MGKLNGKARNYFDVQFLSEKFEHKKEKMKAEKIILKNLLKLTNLNS